ncbi:MAG: DUF5335 family protein [Thermoanaerobaculia bacterium]
MTRIENTDWKAFADRFSKEFDGWSASLQLRESNGSIETAIDDRPFRGLTFEHRGTHDSLILTFGDDADEHLAHIVEQPSEMSVLAEEPGLCSLIIGLADQSGCVLELASPFNPD